MSNQCYHLAAIETPYSYFLTWFEDRNEKSGLSWDQPLARVI